MNLDFDLFISGSPNGDQRWPNDREDLFCKQFFALETGTSNECDFFIEVRTSPEGQRCCYYSYVHRKDVFGLVNGIKRKGAYFAMILRFKEIYCNIPRNIYALMDIVYRNKIEGSIIEKTSTGESYIVESFASKNDKLCEIENLFASQLAVVVNNLMPLDSSFAPSQSGKIVSYNLYEKDDAIIIETLKKHLKVHLLAFPNDQSGAIEGLNSKLSSKCNELLALNSKYTELSTKNQQISSSFENYKKECKQKIDSLEQSNQDLINQVQRLEEEKQKVPQLQALHEWILEYVRKNGSSNTISSEGDNVDRNSECRWHNYIKKYWPYLAMIVIVVFILLLFLNIFGPKHDELSEVERQRYEKIIEEYKDSENKLRTQVSNLEASLNDAEKQIRAIEPVSSDADLIPCSSIIRVDIDSITNETITTGATITPKLRNNKVAWKIKSGDEYAKIQGQKLIVTGEGEVVIVLTCGNKEIHGTERRVTVKTK